jgi:transcriptional regulator with XRE-family HTH domain
VSTSQGMAGRIAAARAATGLSLWSAARRLRVSPWELRGWERGRVDIPLDVRKAMAVLYGTAARYLVPDRPSVAERDEVGVVIRIGTLRFDLDGSDETSMRRFLAAVREERGLTPGVPLAIRHSDAALLADLLGGTADEITDALRRLLGLSEDDAGQLSGWIFDGTTVGAVLDMQLP